VKRICGNKKALNNDMTQQIEIIKLLIFKLSYYPELQKGGRNNAPLFAVF